MVLPLQLSASVFRSAEVYPVLRDGIYREQEACSGQRAYAAKLCFAQRVVEPVASEAA